MNYSRILVAVDNSEHSDMACEAAVELAKGMSATLTGVHVYAARLHDDRFQQMVPTLPERYQNEEEIDHQRKVHDTLIGEGLGLISESYFKPLETACEAAGVPFESVSLEGRNYVRIIEESAQGYDLLVMGSAGLGANERSIIGSVCERVARKTLLDVLVVKNRLTHRGRIAAAVDGSETGFGGLVRAAGLSRVTGCPLEILASFDPDFHVTAFRRLKTVLTEDVAHSFRFDDQEKLHGEVIDTGLAKIYQGHLDAGVRMAREAGSEADSTLLTGKAYPSILDHVEVHEIDLLAIGRIGIHSTESVEIGSTAENLLRLAPCSVLLSATQARAATNEPVADTRLRWTVEATEMAEPMPDFIRSRAILMVEQHAVESGQLIVTSRTVREAKSQFMPS